MIGLFHNGNEGELPNDEFGLFEGTFYGNANGLLPRNAGQNEILRQMVGYATSLMGIASRDISTGNRRMALTRAYDVKDALCETKAMEVYSFPENVEYRRQTEKLEKRLNAFFDMTNLIYPGLKPLILPGDKDVR